MKSGNINNRIGIASLLGSTEIKDYFNTFLVLIGGVEFVIFVAHFIGAIGPDKKAFLWKQYFFISFIAPIVLIFVIGLIVIGFNYYVYGKQDSTFFHKESPFVGTKIKRFGHSFNFLLSVIHQVPILVGMIILGLGSVVLYKFDVVLQVLGQVGEKTAFYLLIILCVCIGGGLIYLLFCLYWKFKLHKYQIQQQWEYKQKVIEKSGLIILDNNTVVNGDGKLITHDVIIENAGDDVVKEKALVPLAEKLLLK
ncbi:MAG: hypothetical protein BA867_02010 [Desulfobacterales bacterium S5133MH16]|jgi:hypothetical protein|nr:MAG: hypothetical protein BA867_02010 [Desulfobacterales bacterium S5133MH16]